MLRSIVICFLSKHLLWSVRSSIYPAAINKGRICKMALCRIQNILFDEPTRGIDVGAKSEMYKIINMLVSEGNAVVVISSELPEILGVCDRIAVFHEGRLTGTLDRAQATQESIMHYALGGQ